MSRSVETGPNEKLDEEAIHNVLRNRRRRLVLDILTENGGTVSVRELSERIGAIESDQDPPPRNVKQSVYVSLLQTHLPKLDDLDIVEYENEGKTVRVDSGLDAVSVYLETVPKYGLSRSEYYAALALLGLLTVVGSMLDTPVISLIRPELWALGFLAFTFASGVFHTYRQGSSIVHRHFF